MVTWSYSSLSLFKQCPRKYYRLRVAQDLKEPEAEHLLYGSAVHKVAEEYGRDGKAIPEKYAFVKPFVDVILESPGNKYFEHEMALTRNFEPCEFHSPNRWWRGIADVLIVRPEENYALVLDYKTGKSARYADTAQLEVLSLATFAHFPEVNLIDAGLVFVVSKEFVEISISRADADKAWQKWDQEVARLEKSTATDVWNPAPNFTCRNHCPVDDCEYNGRR